MSTLTMKSVFPVAFSASLFLVPVLDSQSDPTDDTDTEIFHDEYVSALYRVPIHVCSPSMGQSVGVIGATRSRAAVCTDLAI